MSGRLVFLAVLLTACRSAQPPTAVPAPQRCATQQVAVVANRSNTSVDVFDSRSVLGTVDPGRDGEFVLVPPTTRVMFRATGATGTGLRVEQVQVRYACR